MSDPAEVPRAVHLTVRREGGGTERNVGLLCSHVAEFTHLATEELVGHPPRPWSIGRLQHAVLEHQPEVVFCYGATAHALAMLALPRSLPLVGSIRCEEDFAGRKEWIARRADDRVRFWISNSRAALGDRRGIVIYNGVEDPLPTEKPLLGGLPGPVFGVLGRGHRKKGHAALLDLWASIRPSGALVLGGRLTPGLEQQASGVGARCLGWVPAGDFLRSIDILLIPSSAEGIPTVLLEAMIRGVPVLSTPAGGVREILRHGENGSVLELGDWPGFLQAIDLPALRRMGETALAEARERYTFDRMRREFIAAARRAAGWE